MSNGLTFELHNISKIVLAKFHQNRLRINGEIDAIQVNLTAGIVLIENNNLGLIHIYLIFMITTATVM